MLIQRNHGDALGGPYIAVHMRRKDFLHGHKNEVPSIAWAAHQIRDLLTATHLQTVFIATDAPYTGMTGRDFNVNIIVRVTYMVVDCVLVSAPIHALS